MKDPRMQRTAYLVAHAYTDPNGKMLPQIHAVRIYSESATSLSLCPRTGRAHDSNLPGPCIEIGRRAGPR